jgi:hypothetical protein
MKIPHLERASKSEIRSFPSILPESAPQLRADLAHLIKIVNL